MLLYEIGQSPLHESFVLTGGTALAAFYLHHRYSVDLYLFTDSPVAVAQVPPVMQEMAGRLGLEIAFTRTLGTFLECFLKSPDGERVQLDLRRTARSASSRPDSIPTCACGLTTPPKLHATSCRRFSTGLSRGTLWMPTLSKS
jgi:hypothetical protein